jgi:starch synthase
MYAQAYGSLPIAHATGGLVDSIEDGKTGFLFSHASADALEGAIVRALQVYGEPRKRASMRRAAMARDFTWTSAAEEYEKVYRRAVMRA